VVSTMPDGDRAAEALLICTICRESVSAARYDDHLRLVHRLYSFRGVRRSLYDTVEGLRGLFLRPPPHPQTWAALARIAREVNGPRAADVLAASLAPALDRLAAVKRNDVLPTLAKILAGGGTDIVTALTKSEAKGARTLALWVLVDRPFDAVLVEPLRALLR